MDNMPPSVATTLLLSGQKMSNTFRKVCNQAREKRFVSTALPATAEQKLLKKLGKASAKQLHTWVKRFLRRGNRLQIVLEGSDDAGLKATLASVDAVCETIKAELDKRANRARLKKEKETYEPNPAEIKT